MNREHHIAVRRTARYFTAGVEDATAAREVWLVCHGYAQLASRFLTRCEPLVDGSRLVVAPEGLSRFYLERAGAQPGRVGASWMTREDRLADIDDYLGFLDAVYEQVCAPAVARGAPLNVLGFSQGVATATRWVVRHPGRARRLVAWAALLPPEAPLIDAPWLQGLRLVLVRGTRDALADPARCAQEEERLRQAGVSFESVRFDGGHALDAGVLRTLAST